MKRSPSPSPPQYIIPTNYPLNPRQPVSQDSYKSQAKPGQPPYYGYSFDEAGWQSTAAEPSTKKQAKRNEVICTSNDNVYFYGSTLI